MAIKQILIPDIGDFEDVPIIDVYIKVGDVIDSDSSVVALESEKAVLDVPSPFAGTITKVLLKEGDTVSKGSLVAEIEVASEGEEEKPVEEPKKEEKTEPPKQEEKPEPVAEDTQPVAAAKKRRAILSMSSTGAVYTRRLLCVPTLRMGVDLAGEGQWPNGRILHEDVQALVKKALSAWHCYASFGKIELEDFSKYGDRAQKLTRIQKISGPHLQKSWQIIPMSPSMMRLMSRAEALRRRSRKR